MLEKPYTKNQIQAITRAGKKIRFVDTFQEVKKYYDQKIYAIEADSIALKELINEGEFLVDERILNLQEGIYHIIDINSREVDIKSETKTGKIAYALFKKTGDKDYWNKVYQININPLFNFISETGYGFKYKPEDLVGEGIYIQRIGLVEEAKSYKVSWGVCGDFMCHDQELFDQIELHEAYLYEISDEGQFEAYLQEIEDQYREEEYNSVESQIERLNEDREEQELLQRQLDNHLDSSNSDQELENYLDQMEESYYSDEPEP